MSVSLKTSALANEAFTFLNKSEYLREIIARIKQTKPGDRILTITHEIGVTEPVIADLLEALEAAAQRGAHVSLAVDERTLPVMQRVPITRQARHLLKNTYASLEKLKASGASYAVTNKSHRRLINRFAGRSHIKLTIINDDIYIGGCNLKKMEQLDMMMRWRDKQAADWLYTLMQDVVRQQSTRMIFRGEDREFIVDTKTRLLLDAGKPKQSLIYERALELIDTAEKWVVLTCQFFPNSLTASHLVMASKRGVLVSLYYNHPSKHEPGHNVLHHMVLMHERRRRPGVLFEKQLAKDQPYVHAKLLATDKGVMIGSHNYVAAGVNFGTAELTVVRYDATFAQNAVQFLENQLLKC